MATKSVYQDFDADALKHFGLEADPFYGLVSSSMGVDKVLCTQDQTTYDKIHSIFRSNYASSCRYLKLAKLYPPNDQLMNP